MTIWVISDTHFSHANILKFKRQDGTLVRPGFESVDHMNEVMVERWNKVVKPSDHVYHLGDVAMHPDALKIVQRLNGMLRLVLGNHDGCDMQVYAKAGFKKIFSSRRLANVLFTHIPIHPLSMRGSLGNAHGHIHEKPSPPGLYYNACVEQTNYTPVSLEEVLQNLKWRAICPVAA